MYPAYTKSEDETIRAHYTKEGADFVHKLIPRRTTDAIKTRARQLHIDAPLVPVNVSDRTIIERWKCGKSYANVAKELGVSVVRVTRVMVDYRRTSHVTPGALELPPKGWEA